MHHLLISFLVAGFVFEQLQKGTLKPQIYKVYPLQDAAQAQDDLESGKSIGKLLLKTSE